MVSSTLRSAGQSIGRYLLYDEIASGGMAAIHLGRLVGPAGFSRTVAVKRLHPQYAKNDDFLAMFHDEARLVARIRHPNVVPTLDVVQEGPELLLVMEYVMGESLSRLVRSGGTAVPPSIAATIMAGVLHGLHAAHEAKGENGEPLSIVHRDVSPQNILVGVDGVPRLIDFGVAKAAQRTQSTLAGDVKGKIVYMAPEQITSETVDRRADIFAAGIVLWESLTGTRLFDGPNHARILSKIMSAEIALPSQIVGNLPPAFDVICARALAADPAQRFSTAREMALAIEMATPLAPASEVGSWVDSLSHDALSAMAARISDIESRSDIHASSVVSRDVHALVPITFAEPVTMAASPQGARRRSMTAIPLVLSGLLVAALVLAFVWSKGSPTAMASPRPSAAPAAAPPSPTPEVTALVSPPVVARVDSSAPVPLKRSPVPKRTDCSRPYTIDAAGIKHAKPACL